MTKKKITSLTFVEKIDQNDPQIDEPKDLYSTNHMLPLDFEQKKSLQF